MKTRIWPPVLVALVGTAFVAYLFVASFSRIEVDGPVVGAAPAPPKTFELIASQKMVLGGMSDHLQVYCDAARGNLVYVAQAFSGISVAVVFDPERCAPKEAK